MPGHDAAVRRRPLRLGSLPSCLWTTAGAGPRILALHGFTGSGADFEPLGRSLREPLWAPDLPGHGRAGCPPPAGCRLEAGAASLDHLAARAGLAVLLGYSLGGRHALALATRNPHRFDALILIGASPGLVDPQERRARAAWDAGWARRAERSVDGFTRAWATLPIIATQARADDDVRAAMDARRRRNRGRGLAASLRGAGSGSMPPLWTELPRLALPTLLLAGEDDAAYRAVGERMAQAMPHATCSVVRGAGHAAHIERPRATAEAIDGFLAGIGLSPAPRS
jgi:2-succinyl-6-hydroxy-2,4-cyclohexadiene-1-carboxylate synthase